MDEYRVRHDLAPPGTAGPPELRPPHRVFGLRPRRQGTGAPERPSAEIIPLPLGRPDLWRRSTPPAGSADIVLFTGVRRERQV